MSGIKIPVEAQFDKGDVDAALQQLTQQMNKLGVVIAQANKVKFNPIEKATIDDLRKVTAGFDNLRKVSGDLNKRLKTTGQGNASFGEVDWDKLYPDVHARGRQMQKAFEYVTGNRLQPNSPPGGGSAPPSGGNGPQGPGVGGHARNILGAGLRAAGPAGGVVNSALSTGMSGGITAGLAGLAGGLAALAVGKVVGAVANKVGDAQQEAIGYDTLKRSMGDVNVSFNVLKDSLRENARALDMTFDESQRLGTQFAKLSGLSGKESNTLAEEANVGGGFGRSFGMDPGQSNGFFAQMRLFQVTSNTQQSRELALLIGESIAKSDSFSKADEVLDAISNFTAAQTRSGMNVANVEGYASFLSGSIGSKIPGLDPAGAAALMGRANSSIASGGAAGEAGQNFLYRAIGSRLGLNPIQTATMWEQGAFGTGKTAFGDKSTNEAYRLKFGGDATPKGLAESNTTNLEMTLDQLKKDFDKQPELMANAASNLLGMNNSQAKALMLIEKSNLGGLLERLQNNDIDLNTVNAAGISRIAQINGDSEGNKDERIKAAALEGQLKTDGSETRKTIVGVQNEIQALASKLLDPLNAMRAGIMYMAGGSGKKSSREIQEAMMRADSRDRGDQIGAEYTGKVKSAAESASSAKAAHRAALDELKKNYGSYSPEERAAAQKRVADLWEASSQKEEEARQTIIKLQGEKAEKLAEENRRLDENIKAMRDGPAKPEGPSTGGFARVDRRGGASAGARGYRNNNPGNIEASGITWQGQTGSDGRFAIFDTPENGYRALGKNLLSYQNKHGLNTIRGIIGRWAPAGENNTAAYIAEVSKEMGVGPDDPLNLSQQSTLEKMMTSIARHENGGLKHGSSVISAGASAALGGETSTPLPAGSSPGDGMMGQPTQRDARFQFEHTINVHNQAGQPVAAPVKTRQNLPDPRGERA